MRSEIFNRILIKSKQNNMKWYKKIGEPYENSHTDAPIIGEIYPENFTWGIKVNTVKQLTSNITFSKHWQYVGEFDSKPEVIGYKFNCPKYEKRGNFINGKIYQLRKGKKLKDFCAFIDESGDVNGFQGNNEKYFEPVYGVTPKKQEIYYQVKEEYVQYFRNLMKSNMSVTDILTREIEIDSPWYNICVKAEVLDLWCNKMHKLDYLF